MKKKEDLTEPEDRFCPICDEEIKKGSPPHHCNDTKIKQLEKRFFLQEKLKNPDVDKSYNDRLRDFDRFYNQETYYQGEEEDV